MVRVVATVLFCIQIENVRPRQKSVDPKLNWPGRGNGGFVRKSIATIEEWLARNANPLLLLLNPPTSPAEIDSFENEYDVTMPPDARALYSIHNGEADPSDGIFGCWRWLPLRVVGEEIKLIETKGIVPLFRSGGGDLYYVKTFQPERPDQRLYEWSHEAPTKTIVVAESLEQFIAGFVTQLLENRYVYLPDELKALVDRDEL
jgi:hypothetical protein